MAVSQLLLVFLTIVISGHLNLLSLKKKFFFLLYSISVKTSCYNNGKNNVIGMNGMTSKIKMLLKKTCTIGITKILYSVLLRGVKSSSEIFVYYPLLCNMHFLFQLILKNPFNCIFRFLLPIRSFVFPFEKAYHLNHKYS